MNHSLAILSVLLIIGCAAPVSENKPDPDQEEWVQIFNGKDLTGWTPKFTGYEAGDNIRNTFRITDDSLLSVRYDNWERFDGEFGHLFYEKPFSHYRIRATYRFKGEQVTDGPAWALRNNGLMLHAQSVETMAIDQAFPICIEFQLLGGNGTDERSTCNLCTPGTHVYMGDSLFTPHCINSVSKTYHGEQWVTVEGLLLGDSLVQHIVDGEVVMEYNRTHMDGSHGDNFNEGVLQDGMAVDKGYITIQAETAPIDFDKIEVLDLCGCMDKKAKNYKSYFVKADNSKCIY
ncbi:MAG: DUF1080 domain-containing protein [Cyclobacteriaceae bacterium]